MSQHNHIDFNKFTKDQNKLMLILLNQEPEKYQAGQDLEIKDQMIQ